jgi:hypothetical protein
VEAESRLLKLRQPKSAHNISLIYRNLGTSEKANENYSAIYEWWCELESEKIQDRYSVPAMQKIRRFETEFARQSVNE